MNVRVINKILFGLFLLAFMSLSATVAIELALYDTLEQIEELPPVSTEVKRLMRYHGVTFFDFHNGEYGFWRDGKWCPAR